MTQSSFMLRGRGDGFYAVVEVVITLDDGDRDSMIAFIVDNADEAAMTGSLSVFTADDGIILTLSDDADTNQDLMLYVLELGIAAGRFDVPSSLHDVIFPPP